KLLTAVEDQLRLLAKRALSLRASSPMGAVSIPSLGTTSICTRSWWSMTDASRRASLSTITMTKRRVGLQVQAAGTAAGQTASLELALHELATRIALVHQPIGVDQPIGGRTWPQVDRSEEGLLQIHDGPFQAGDSRRWCM